MSEPVASVKIVRDRVWKEWIVRAYNANGKRMPDADYHTDDKADAEATAKVMVNAPTVHPQ